MADAKKCDVCGKFYEESGSGGSGLDRMSAAMKRISETLTNKHDKVAQIEAVVDLCPECSSSLKDWFKERERG